MKLSSLAPTRSVEDSERKKRGEERLLGKTPTKKKNAFFFPGNPREFSELLNEPRAFESAQATHVSPADTFLCLSKEAEPTVELIETKKNVYLEIGQVWAIDQTPRACRFSHSWAFSIPTAPKTPRLQQLLGAAAAVVGVVDLTDRDFGVGHPVWGLHAERLLVCKEDMC